MLSLDRPLDIDGIAVFRDHADPNLFWYLPGPVRLARRQDSNRAAFSFIKYKPAVAGAGLKGGGFAMFETTLALDPKKEQAIKARVMTEPRVTQPRLSPVIFEEGTVQCIALNMQGSGGGGAAEAPPPGAFNAVEEILGATVPSMDAQNRAAFSLVLSQEGTTILEQALEQGLAPIGVLYSFVYSGMRPALEVEITADLEMVYNHFSLDFDVQIQWVRAGIDLLFEKLKQTGVIKIKILNFTGEADEAEQESWALEFFKNDLLSKWFEPTFAPGILATEQAKADSLEAVAKLNSDMLGGLKLPAKDEKPETKTDPKAGDAAKTDTKTTTETKTAGVTINQTSSQTSVQTQQTPPQPILYLAAFDKVSCTPDLLPDGQSISHLLSETGTLETVIVTGAGATVKVDGKAVALDQQGQFKVDVQLDKSVQVEVTWPAAVRQETFNLYFDMDKPPETGWGTTSSCAAFIEYLDNKTKDQRFLNASGIADGDGAKWSGPELGAARLEKWFTTLAEPKKVEIAAYASFEQANNKQLQAEYNKRLSQRRLEVVKGIAGRKGVAQPASAAHGDTEARKDPNNPATGNPNDRVVKIKGSITDGQPSTWKGTLARPKVALPEQTTTPKQAEEQKPKKEEVKKSNNMPGVVSLKLKHVHKEELKKLSLYFNRAEATRRVYAPQGFFGLLLGELEDKSSYFTEVDLDDPFFRELNIQAEAPIDFNRIGLSSAQLALDYGDPGNPKSHKHSDFVFREGDQGPKDFAVFLNSNYDVDYLQQQQFHFSPDSGWESDKYSIELPAERTVDRTLFINPHEVLDFMEITLIPGDIDAGIVASTEATLRATGPAGFDMKKVFTILPDSPPQIWKLRAPKPAVPEDRTVTCTLKHRLKDGAVHEQLPIELTSPTLLVHDPFDQALNIEFIPLFDAAKVRQIFIDVEYNDPVNRYSRSERLNIKGDQIDNAKLRIALLDPKHREFKYRFTVVGTDDFRQLAYQTTEEELIPILV